MSLILKMFFYRNLKGVFLVESLTEILVIEEHIDIEPVGHVNNVRFVEFLEAAREEWYKKAGLSYEEMAKKKLGTVILKMNLLFLKEARLGDTLKIITGPQKIGNKSFVFQQKVFNQFDVLILESTVTYVMVDSVERKSIPVVEEIVRNMQL
jgi:YbgC/YbaW family acyl-CoA thioester hydrolase